MRNSPRSSVTVAAVAAATLVGLSSDTAVAVLEEDGHIINSNGNTSPYERHVAITGCSEETQRLAEETQKLAHEFHLAEGELQTLRAQTKAQAEQIDGLLMERDTAEAVCATACEDTGETYSGEHGGLESGM